MKLEVYQVDAFANKVFEGNPAAVIPLDSWLDAGLMQQIAMENNLSETVFFVRNDGLYEIRWFTPTHEIELCGHATLASAFVIFEVLKGEQASIKFYSHQSGDLKVDKQNERFTLDFPSLPVSEVEAPGSLIEAIGKTPSEVYKARNYFLVYESEQEILEISPDFNALLNFDAPGIIVTAKGSKFDFVSRFFAPKIGINEDPVTGSAHCNLIPYWAKKLGKEKLTAKQVSSRGGELFCELNGDRVNIGGNAVLFLKGEIHI